VCAGVPLLLKKKKVYVVLFFEFEWKEVGKLKASLAMRGLINEKLMDSKGQAT
jgi:hypothetical protein